MYHLNMQAYFLLLVHSTDVELSLRQVHSSFRLPLLSEIP